MNVMAIYPGFGASLLGAFLSRPNEIRPQVIIENRDYAVSTLISHMESGHLPAVPIWDDLATFNAIPWTQRVDLVLANFSHLGLEDIPDVANLLVSLKHPLTIMEFHPDFFNQRERVIVFCGRLQSMDFRIQITELSASQIGFPHGRKRIFMVLTPANKRNNVADPRQKRMEGFGRVESFPEENTRTERSGYNDHSQQNLGRIERLLNKLPVPPAPKDRDNWQWVLESWPDFSPALPESAASHLHGMADGFSNRLDRLWILGQESVPQVWATIITSVLDNLLLQD